MHAITDDEPLAFVGKKIPFISNLVGKLTTVRQYNRISMRCEGVDLTSAFSCMTFSHFTLGWPPNKRLTKVTQSNTGEGNVMQIEGRVIRSERRLLKKGFPTNP